ncbi:MAG TPA: HNH endonuclease signature motif containing protein [Methanosarcina sp.]|nr:HNH endonuclease signature motif containing protein [Methanosarcina sp.]
MEFKTIPHYPNYEVSKEGLIRNKSKGTFMKWVDNGKGYKSVKLYNSDTPKGRYCLVHRLVMSTYNPIDGFMDVNHIDGNKSNNHLSNLEWITKSDNTRHAHLTGLFKNKLSIENVKDIKGLLKNSKYNYTEIGKLFGVGHATIWKIANGILYDYI